MRKTNCKAELKQGMVRCADEKKTPTRTKGFNIRGLGCINYSIQITGNMRDDSPPWKAPVKHFPPPVDAGKPGGGTQAVRCHGTEFGRPIAEHELERAIAAFCKNGVTIVGYGTRDKGLLFDWPPKAEHPYYWSSDLRNGLQMYLSTGAQTVNQGAPQPYADMKDCE